MRDLGILMVIGGLVTLLYIHRKNIRFDFTFQFKAGDVPPQKPTRQEVYAGPADQSEPDGEPKKTPQILLSKPGTANPSAAYLPDTAVFGQSKTVFERRMGTEANTAEQPAFSGLPTANQEAMQAMRAGEADQERDDEQEEDEQDDDELGDDELEMGGVPEHPHYSLRDQLSTVGALPPLADVPLAWEQPPDPFRFVPDEENDLDLEEAIHSVVGEPGTVPSRSVNPTSEMGTPVTLYWQRIEDVHRHAQSLNRLFRRHQRKKELEVLTTQFLNLLTDLEMRADANVVWLLDDFLAQSTPGSLPTDAVLPATHGTQTAPPPRRDDEFAVFGQVDTPSDEYRNLYIQLRRSAAQLEAAAPSIDAVPGDDIDR